MLLLFKSFYWSKVQKQQVNFKYIYIYTKDFNILHGASVYLCGNLRDLVNDTIFIFILKLSKFSNDSKMG